MAANSEITHRLELPDSVRFHVSRRCVYSLKSVKATSPVLVITHMMFHVERFWEAPGTSYLAPG